MTKPSRLTARARLTLGGTAAIAAIATTAILAATGSAQTSGTTLHLLTNAQNNVGFFPKHAPRPGDHVGFGDKVTGDDTGYSRIACTVFGGKGDLPCTIWLKLSKGTLIAQGLLPERAHNTQAAISGGTGAYNGARGTAYATDISQTSSRLTIQLLP